MKHLAMVVATALFGCGLAAAQAPAGAPAGTNGICKDGTYSTAASKSGACNGHKGVQTWYAATPAKAAAAPAAAAKAPVAATTTAPKPAVMPPPTPAVAQSIPSRPAPAPAPAVSSAPAPKPGAKLSPAQAAAAKTAQPGGKPGLVWVNTSSNVYHCYGDTYYGKTTQGAYMSEADAKGKGAHGDHGKTCAGK